MSNQNVGVRDMIRIRSVDESERTNFCLEQRKDSSWCSDYHVRQVREENPAQHITMYVNAKAEREEKDDEREGIIKHELLQLSRRPTRYVPDRHVLFTVPCQRIEMVGGLFRKLPRGYEDKSADPSRLCFTRRSRLHRALSNPRMLKKHPPRLTALEVRIFCTIGIQYAAVFPLPVRALAKISRPSKASGMVLLWTRVGLGNPKSARARRILVSRRCLNEEKVSAESTSRESAINEGVLGQEGIFL